MKRLLSAILALSLFSGTAAIAGPYNHGGQGFGVTNGYSHGDRGRGSYYGRRDYRNNDGAAVATGVGILALIAILASQNRHDERQAVMGNPSPPQPYDAYPQDYQGSRDYQGGQNGNPPDGPYYDNNGGQQ